MSLDAVINGPIARAGSIPMRWSSNGIVAPRTVAMTMTIKTPWHTLHTCVRIFMTWIILPNMKFTTRTSVQGERRKAVEVPASPRFLMRYGRLSMSVPRSFGAPSRNRKGPNSLKGCPRPPRKMQDLPTVACPSTAIIRHLRHPVLSNPNLILLSNRLVLPAPRLLPLETPLFKA